MGRDRRRRGSCLGRVFVVVVLLALAAVLWSRGAPWIARIQHPLAHETAIAAAAESERLDPYLVAALINAESGYREGVVSPAGAVGLMQILPSTAKAVARNLGIAGKMNTAALKDADTNIRVGTAYLAELVARYGGSVDLALAAYNAGMTNADRWAGTWKRSKGPLSDTIDFPETAHYVDDVLEQEQTYRSLYPDAFPGQAAVE